MRILTAKEVNFVSGGFDALTCPGLNSDGNDVQKSKEGADGENAGSSGGGREMTYEEAHKQMCEAIAATQVIGTSVALAGTVAAVAGAGPLGGVVAGVGVVTGAVATGASYIGGC